MDDTNQYGLRETHLSLIKMLKLFDEALTKANINYVLVFGSALGAIRHKGIIPWDDDIDLAIFRKDLSRAEKVLKNMDYYLYEEAEKHIEPSAPIGHLRDIDKTKKECHTNLKQYPTIDLWIIDQVPETKFKQKVFRAISLFHDFTVYRVSPQFKGSVIKTATSFVLAITPKVVFDKLQKWSLDKMEQIGKGSHLCTAASFIQKFRVYDRAVFTDTERMPFEGMMLPVSKHYDEFLTRFYGDYMSPPKDKMPDHHS